MKLSVYYGKKIESAEGRCGYVLCVNAEGGKLQSLTCADADEREFFVDVKSIKSVKTKILYKGEEIKESSARPLRLGKPVFDCEGNYLGKLTDYTVENNTVTFAHIGNKKFSADDLVSGDAVIIKSSARVLKSDVKKNGRVIIKRGTSLTGEVLEKAQKHGEYVQASLKSIELHVVLRHKF